MFNIQMFLNDSALVYIMLIFYDQINFIQVHVQISQRDSELHEQGIDLMPPPPPGFNTSYRGTLWGWNHDVDSIKKIITTHYRTLRG